MADKNDWEKISAVDPDTEGRSFLTRYMPVVLAFAAIGVFGAVVWYAYEQGKAGEYQEVVPTLHAEYDSFKSKPADPGGMQIPHQDKYAYRALEGESAESDGEDLSSQAQVVAEESMDAIDRAVRDVARGTQEIIDDSVSAVERGFPTAPSLPESDAADSTSARGEETQTAAVDISEPTRQPQQPGVVSEEEAKEATQVASLPTAESVTQGPWRVQIVSLRDEAAATKVQRTIEAGDPELFQGLPVFVERKDLGDKGIYYRVQVGAFVEKSSAKQLCDLYKAAGKSCLLVKN